MRKSEEIRPELESDMYESAEPEAMAAPTQGRMPTYGGPLTDDLTSREDIRSYVEDDLKEQSNIQPPGEMDADGNRLEHEGEWAHDLAAATTDEDVADTHDWRNVPPIESYEDEGWINEKLVEGLAGDRVDEITGKPIE